MKKSVFILLSVVIAVGLILSGCPTESAGVSNTKLSPPKNAKYLVGTEQLGFMFDESESIKDYDILYRFWVREKGTNSKFEIVSMGVTGVSPDVGDVGSSSGGTGEGDMVRIRNGGFLAFPLANWDNAGAPGSRPASVGSNLITSTGASYVNDGAGIMDFTEFREGTVTLKTPASDQNKKLVVPTQSYTPAQSPEKVKYAQVLSIARVIKRLDLPPFAPGDVIEFGVQTILDPGKYVQQTNLMDPSEIVWFSPDKNDWIRP